MIKKYRILWIISIAFSSLLLLMTAHIIYKFANYYHPDPTQITSNEQLTDELNKGWFASDKGADTILIPTGIFVNSVYFLSPYNVHISGYVWQKYDHTSMHLEEKMLEFPEGVNVEIKESYRGFEDGILTLGWHFEGEFIQNFDYFDFPMDNKVAWVRIWHSTFDNVILTPDLASYDSTKAGDKFGIDPEIVLSGYSLLETFFSLKNSSYDTNFGVKNFIGQKNFPELYFNIVLRRDVINSAIIYFLPLVTAIALMFFGILLITTRPDHLSFLGYSLINLLSLAAFLLFIVVLSHIQLRTQVTSKSVIYLEYIYIIVYAAIIYGIGVAFIIDHASQLGLKKVYANDGFWAKVTFLPLVTGAFFLATYLSF